MDIKRIAFILIGLVFSLPLIAYSQDNIEAKDSLPSDTINLSITDIGIPSYNPNDSTTFLLDSLFEYPQNDKILRLAVVLSDIYSKKDMEFTKGFLLGLKQASLPPLSLSLKVVNGGVPMDSVMNEIDVFDPQVVISTFDKETPLLLDFASQLHKFKLLNVFDAKGEGYLNNEEGYQILAPSESFNASIASFLKEKYPEDILILLGDPDFNDLMIRDLILEWPEDNILIMTDNDLKDFTFEENSNYIIIPISQNYEDVKRYLSDFIRLLAETPSLSLKVLGRPNWVTFSDLNALIANLEVFIPSRCYFDTSSEQSKRFISNYKEAYGHSPIKSTPVYSVMGYDVAKYFIPAFIEELETGTLDLQPKEMVQSYFNLEKCENGGRFNKGSFVLHFDPWGTMKKETIN